MNDASLEIEMRGSMYLAQVPFVDPGGHLWSRTWPFLGQVMTEVGGMPTVLWKA
jgi:hypothetical protein